MNLYKPTSKNIASRVFKKVYLTFFLNILKKVLFISNLYRQKKKNLLIMLINCTQGYTDSPCKIAFYAQTISNNGFIAFFQNSYKRNSMTGWGLKGYFHLSASKSFTENNRNNYSFNFYPASFILWINTSRVIFH